MSLVLALRPRAHVFVAPPLLFGQALALATCGTFSWRLLVWTQVVGVLAHVLVTSGRAAARRRTRALVAALFGSLLALAAAGAWLAFRESRPFLLALLMLAPMLLWADAFPPLELARRGHGHVIQGLGAGAVLPAVGFCVQCGELTAFPPAALAAVLLASVAGGVSASVDASTPGSLRVGALVLLAAAALATPHVVPGAPLAIALATSAGALAFGLVATVRRCEPSRFARALAVAVIVLELGWTAGAFLAPLPRP